MSSLITYLIRTYMLFTGCEVRIGRNCARGLEYRPRPQAEGGTQTEGTVSPNTDRPRPVNNIFIFFLLRFKSFRKIYFSLQPMCVEEGRVRVDVIQSARSIANQNIHYNMIFNLQLILSQLISSLQNKERLLCLGGQFII